MNRRIPMSQLGEDHDVDPNYVLTAAGRFVAGGVGGGAPTGAQYLVVALDGGLSAERRLVAGAGISFTDGGANGDFTITATGGGGTAAQVTLDFGAGAEQASVALADAAVVATTRAAASMAIVASADKTADEVLADPIWVACQVVAGVGLTVFGKPLAGGQLFGKYLVDVIYK